MARTAINLYSVRELNEPLLNIIDRVANAGYDGIQFSGELRNVSATAVRKKLDETDLTTVGAHIDIGQLEGNLDETTRTYHDTLGCGSAVVPYLDESQFTTATDADRTADRLESLAARFHDRGWALHYHNHAHEFTKLGTGTAIERLIDQTDYLGIELDVGWAFYSGHDPANFIDRYGDRINLVHMKDVTTDTDSRTPFCEIGVGDVNMHSCAAAAHAAGAEWLIYEHDQPDDPVASIDVGATFINSL